MKQHEREFFISTIRYGVVSVEGLEIKPLTIDQSFQASHIYKKAYDQAFMDEVMTEEEMDVFMEEKGIWSYEDDEVIKRLEKDISRLKEQIYISRADSKKVRTARAILRAGEKQLDDKMAVKNTYFINTLEGVATAEKMAWTIRNTTYKEGKLYDFDDLSIDYVLSQWQKTLIPEHDIRDLARNEPWKSLWVVRDKSGCDLFYKRDNQELTINQKNLVMWSQMYDNIQESVDCPDDDVINDDDMLDGWFIIQSKKRKKEKLEQQLDSLNPKIANSQEVFLVNNEKPDERVEALNDSQAKARKRARSNIIKKKGTVQTGAFPDEVMDMQNRQSQAFKDKFTRS